MELVFILSYYSAFKPSFNNNEWNVHGMPAVAKMLDYLRENKIKFRVLFVIRDHEKDITLSKSIEGFISPFDFIYKKKSSKYLVLLTELGIWLRIKKICINNKNPLYYCDRANMTIGSFFAFFTKFPVFLRLHGINTLYSESKKLKWKILNIDKLISFKAPYKQVLCTEDGTPSQFFLKENFKKNIGITWLNGIEKSKIKIDTNSSNLHEITILFVGRLDETKGLDLFLQLAERILNLEKKIKVILIGTGPLLYKVEDFKKRLSNTSDFHFYGAIPHNTINNYYLKSTFYVSFNELGNLSNTMLEALNCGCIPITFEPGLLTKRDISTHILLHDLAFFVNPADCVKNSLSIIDFFLNNPNEIIEHKKKIIEFSSRNLSSWDERIEKEFKLLKSIYDNNTNL